MWLSAPLNLLDIPECRECWTCSDVSSRSDSFCLRLFRSHFPLLDQHPKEVHLNPGRQHRKPPPYRSLASGSMSATPPLMDSTMNFASGLERCLKSMPVDAVMSTNCG
jgi:hypothetical protein